jgi:hypothetical protein
VKAQVRIETGGPAPLGPPALSPETLRWGRLGSPPALTAPSVEHHPHAGVSG